MKTYYSNGKLLITGEYVVLDGAQALALPTKFGQYLMVEKSKETTIYWKSYDSDETIWFEDEISFHAIQNKTYDTTTHPVKNKLIDILHEAYQLSNEFLHDSQGYTIHTTLTFPKKWGLGTSSTLINNIAQWLNIDAFELLNNSFGGSGYDIACAQTNSAIVYQLNSAVPQINLVPFNPPFKNHIYFVYLNKKQNSQQAIQNYYNKKTDVGKIIPSIDKITQQIINTQDMDDFCVLLYQHEAQLSLILESMTIQEALFPDFDGIVKSLGAWGGDFVLAVSKNNPTNYFHNKGFFTVIPYIDMIL